LSAGQPAARLPVVVQHVPELVDEPMTPLASPPNERTPVRFALAGDAW
jgi:hypothetical protein